MKKATCLTLALLMFASCFVLASCQDPIDAVTTDQATMAPAETDVVTDRLYAEVPDSLDFGGGTITFLTKNGDGDQDWACRDIYVENETEDPIETAVFRRNVTLEEKYKVTIVEETVSSASTVASKSIKSGSDDYQVLLVDTQGTLTLMRSKLLRDLNEVGGIDLSQPWWDQNLVNNCSIGGKNFFATGDISIMDNDATWVMMFNKSMIEQFDLESPYDLVKANNWTYDKMYEMMLTVAGDSSGDLNGNTKVDYDTDRFGFVTHNSSLAALYYAAGLKVVTKDSSDMPAFADSDMEYVTKVLDKSIKIFNDKSITWSADRDGYSAVELQEIFQTGRGLFMGEVLQLVIRLREMDLDFGLIPFPKFDSTQENYGHFVHSTSVLLSIPTTCVDYENISYFVEAMACESKYTLTLAYYDTALKNSYLRDPDSTEMLDIILASRTFDLGSTFMFNWGGIASIFTSLLSGGKTDYASQYKKKIAKAKTALDKDINKMLGE